MADPDNAPTGTTRARSARTLRYEESIMSDERVSGMTDAEIQDLAAARPVTADQVGMQYGARVWEAIDRRNELDQRYHRPGPRLS